MTATTDKLIMILKTELTPTRKEDLNRQLIEATCEIERIQDLMKRQASEQKQYLERHRRLQGEAAHALSGGFEMLPVECVREVDTEAKTVKVIRQDTKAVVSERPLELEHRTEKTKVLRKH